jgi:hypothetical protein
MELDAEEIAPFDRSRKCFAIVATRDCGFDQRGIIRVSEIHKLP